MTKISSHGLAEIASRYGWRKTGSRWTGKCPRCGGSERTDRFSFWENGAFKCFSCEFKGDLITWYREMESMSCPDAHEAAGRACRSTTCPHRSTCRLGDGSSQTVPRRSRRPLRQPEKQQRRLPTSETKDPSRKWIAWATELQHTASIALPGQAQAVAWLAGRGINLEAARSFGIGWLEHDRKVARLSLGLSPVENGKDTVWVPGGLVIPTMDDSGGLHRLRIRRSGQARSKFLPDLKYVWITGSGTRPWAVLRDGARGTVIVEAELDGIAVAAAHDEVNVIALGTVSGGLPGGLRDICAASPVVLVALDADAGAEGAGPRAVATWGRTFRKAKFWPVPAGKDPGEYAERGNDLHPWVEAGLPPRICHARHDLPVSLDDNQSGDVGANETDSKGYRGCVTERAGDTGPGRFQVTLEDGRNFHVVENKSDWLELTGKGEMVFSAGELERLQSVVAGMDEGGRLAALDKVMDMKEVFGGAYVKRSSAVKTST